MFKGSDLVLRGRPVFARPLPCGARRALSARHAFLRAAALAARCAVRRGHC